jgi:hypothetical protein
MIPYASTAALIVMMALAPGERFQPTTQRSENGDVLINRITIRIADKAFTATLADNPTAAALKQLLPLSITMTELNGNEKLFRLPGALPTRESRPSSIHTGDLMLYGSSTLVVFYKSFPTTYSYTAIGRIDDPAGLEAALGPGDVTVVFEAASKKP